MVGFEFANNGARLVHGCDVYERGIETAREIFADIRNCRSQFEVVDLTQGPGALAVFGRGEYDLTLILAVVHKLARVMSEESLRDLLRSLAARTTHYVAANAIDEQADLMEECFSPLGFRRVHWSKISTFGLGVIWQRGRSDV